MTLFEFGQLHYLYILYIYVYTTVSHLLYSVLNIIGYILLSQKDRSGDIYSEGEGENEGPPKKKRRLDPLFFSAFYYLLVITDSEAE